MGEQRTRAWCATGVFLALLGIYFLTTAGRIDIIDGQWRYEAAKNWLDSGAGFITSPHAISERLDNVVRGYADVSRAVVH